MPFKKKVVPGEERGAEYPKAAGAPAFMPDMSIEDDELPYDVEVRPVDRPETYTTYSPNGKQGRDTELRRQGTHLHLDLERTTVDRKSGLPSPKGFHEKVRMPFRASQTKFKKNYGFDTKDVVRAIYALEGRGVSFEVVAITKEQVAAEKKMGKEMRLGVTLTKADLSDTFAPSVIDDGRPAITPTGGSNFVGVGQGKIPVAPMATA